jgi:NDP-sugar pyrophosphorylase family protein
VVGAIILVAPKIPQLPRGVSAAKNSGGNLRPGEFQNGTPLACVEVLGRSVLERGVDQLLRAGVNAITILGDSCFAPVRSEVDQASTNFPFTWEDDAWLGATRILRGHKEPGMDVTFLVRAAAYVELDPLDALQFHQGQRQVVTRAFDEEGPLDLWIIDTARVTEGEDIVATLGESEPAHYAVSGYVNRLEGPHDLRRLVVDSLSSRCRLRPQGSETRPGVWMNEGAQVHRTARIVAPAFLGRKSKIEEQCLITRCSNVESNCQIDYGTVVEDSSILSNSYVGIGLDVSHSIVNGKQLLNLERDVALEIQDPGMIRRNAIPRKEASLQRADTFDWEEMISTRDEEKRRLDLDDVSEI